MNAQVIDQIPALELVPDIVRQVTDGRPPRTWGTKWAAAIVKAQASFPRIEKNAEATITGERANYKYMFAEYGLILERVQPILGENGLALLQDGWTETCEVPDADGKPCRATRVTVQTTILHESGEFREFPALSHAGIELRISEVGGLLSFLRRYSAVTALRVAPFGEDDDAASLQGDQPQQRPAQRQQARLPARPRGGAVVNPRGDARENADPQKVKLYTNEFVKAAARRDDLGVRELWVEMKGDQDLTIVVWDQLKKEHRTEFDFVNTTVKASQ